MSLAEMFVVPEAQLGNMLAAIPLLPLLGAMVNGFFGRRLGHEKAALVATSAVLGSFAVSIAIFVQLVKGSAELHTEVFRWFQAGGLDVHLGLSADHLSGILLLVITGVGSLIHWYSSSYMEHDAHSWRYFAYLNLFVAAMLLLVLGDNLVTLFVGWEGVGLCSYLLIGFWFTDDAKASAGKKAFITNRIGDFGFLIGMFTLYAVFGTLNVSELKAKARGIADYAAPVSAGLFRTTWQNKVDGLKTEAVALRQEAAQTQAREQMDAARAAEKNANAEAKGEGAAAKVDSTKAAHLREKAGSIDEKAKEKEAAGPPTYHLLIGLALLCLFIGATGKSAQIPLYVWLPDAMAGPTPVSALIHAATMVTAGVYMMGRLSFLYVHVPEVLAVAAVVGVLTAFFAALMAFGQNDIKKVLAYSTVSQLGFMFVGVGAGAFGAGTYHLLTHAFFKACLFLGSGAVIHGLHDEQDIRHMGGLKKYMPQTRMTFLIATITIAGILPFSGFFSKDEILHQAQHSAVLHAVAPWLGMAVYLLGTVTALCTSFYMFRVYFLTFEGEYRGHAHPHESPPEMTIPLWILAILSIAAALLSTPLSELFEHLTGAHGLGFEAFTAPAFATFQAAGEAAEGAAEGGVPWLAFLIALIVAWAGFFAARSMYGKGMATPESDPLFAKAPAFANASNQKFWVDEFYQKVVIGPLWWGSKQLHKWADAFLIDRVFVNGSAQLTDFVARIVSPFQNGDLSRYAALTAIAVAGLLVWAVS